MADSDEYDDKADAKFDAALSTPAIDISGAAPGSLFLAYDSSWRKEPQYGKVIVSYDDAEPVVLLELTPDTPTGYDDTVVLALENPEGAGKAVIMWDHQGHNNWWWAIDNIIVGTEDAITDGDEAPAITSIAVEGGVLTIAWPSADGLRLQRAAAVTGPWETSKALRARIPTVRRPIRLRHFIAWPSRAGRPVRKHTLSEPGPSSDMALRGCGSPWKS